MNGHRPPISCANLVPVQLPSKVIFYVKGERGTFNNGAKFGTANIEPTLGMQVFCAIDKCVRYI